MMEVTYDQIDKASNQYGGWYNGTMAVLRNAYPNVDEDVLSAIAEQCGVHPPPKNGTCGYQGSMNSMDFAKLNELLSKESK